MNLARLIAAQRNEHGIPHATACRALGVSQAWFYKWRGGDRSVQRARRAALDAVIAWLFHAHHGRCGSPRIHAGLADLGWKVSKNTVAASMRAQGLAARPKRKRKSTTKADKLARKAPDALRRNFTPPPRPDVAWVGDLKRITTGEGVLHLAAVLDLHSRRCVGFAMGPRHDAELATAALQVAIAVRGGAVAGVIMHTGQGGEYTGAVFAKACTQAGAVQSMGRTGPALGNTVAGAFNSTLEFELLAGAEPFATHQQARHTIADWIDGYNTVRRHSTANMMAPVTCELTRAAGGNPQSKAA